MENMFSKGILLLLIVAVLLVIDTQARLPLERHDEYARTLLSKFAKREHDRTKHLGKNRFPEDSSYLKRAAPAGCETCCSAWWCRMVNEDACLCAH